jgi:Polyketide cyclase / dehydrase and lipid transport
MAVMATVRHHVVVDASADAAWSLLGDPARLTEWFPGVTDCVVEGTKRTITLATGLSMPEEIVTVDNVQRRFQYSLILPIVKSHLSTIDVLDLENDRCCCVYGVDAVPPVMALVIAGAAAQGLQRAKQILEVA